MISLCGYRTVESLQSDPDTLLFIAAYNGILKDYSVYNNELLVSDGVELVHDPTGMPSSIGASHTIRFHHDPAGGIMLKLTAPITVDTIHTVVFGIYRLNADNLVARLGSNTTFVQFMTHYWYPNFSLRAHYYVWSHNYASDSVGGSNTVVCCYHFLIQSYLPKFQHRITTASSVVGAYPSASYLSLHETSAPAVDFSANELRYVQLASVWDLHQRIITSPSAHTLDMAYFILYRGAL